MITEGFEPSPLRTSALSWRLRPLGHVSDVNVPGSNHCLNALADTDLPAPPTSSRVSHPAVLLLSLILNSQLITTPSLSLTELHLAF